MMNKGMAALTAQSIVGNEGLEVFGTEMEIAAEVTKGSNLEMNDLLTKKDAIFKEMAEKTNNIEAVGELKGLLAYIEKDPHLVQANVFSKVSNLMQQLNMENIKTTEQAKTM